jgi:hypothetical protein
MSLVFLSVLVIALLIGVLAIYLFWVGVLLHNIADNLDDCLGSVKTILGHAEVIIPAVEHINRTGGVVSGALPLLYGFTDRIGAKLAAPAPSAGPSTNLPASGRRRSRLMDTVGFRPSQH